MNDSVNISAKATAAKATAARKAVVALLNRMSRDQLTVTERLDDTASTTTFGPGGGLAAEIDVNDTRAYVAVMTEGSIGLGRGYIEGWWTSPDPMTVVQVLIRNMAPIDAARNRLQGWLGPSADLLRRLRPRDSRDRNREDISAHYDLGNDLFALFLDETMTYSSAVFPSLSSDLGVASRNKYEILFDKIGLQSHHHLLDIGCGWGGLAVHAAETIGCRVTGVTISAEQLHEARIRAKQSEASDRIEIVDSDWRDLTGTYDRIISVEMIEAVDWREYDDYFSTIERCLAPDGLAAIQAICLPDQRWERAKSTEDFIQRFVFPNGYLPSLGAIVNSVGGATTLGVVGVEDLTAHYAETLRRWRDQFERKASEVERLGFDERFRRLWRFYLSYCEAAFLERHCTLLHVELAGSAWRGSALRPRSERYEPAY